MPRPAPREPIRSLRARLRSGFARKAALPLAVLLTGIALTLLLAGAMRQEIQRATAERFDAVAADLARRIEDRFDDYSGVLNGLRARFNTEPAPTRQDFAAYVAGLNLKKSYPGLLALTYAPLVDARDKAAFEARVRREAGLPPAIAGRFAIKPESEQPDYYPLTFIEPMAGNEMLLGTDIASMPNRRQTLERSRASGDLTSSGGRIRIPGRDDDVGLAMRLPVYRTQARLDSDDARRAAYVGSVGAGFSITAMMRDVMAHGASPSRRVRLLDAGPAATTGRAESRFVESPGGQLLYDSAGSAPRMQAAHLERALVFEFGGRSWLIEVSDDERRYAGQYDAALPALAALAGMLISGLLAGVIWSLSTGRGRAQALAHAMTSHLRDSERQLGEAQRLASIGSWVHDPATGVLHCSDEALRLFGLGNGAEADVRSLMARVPPDERAAVERQVAEAARGRVEFEHPLRLRDGTERWLHVIVEPTEQDGRPLLRGVVRDDTQRRKSARRLQLEHEVARLLLDDGEGMAVIARALEAACVHLRWDCAALWRIDADGRARCTAAWHVAGAPSKLQQFVRSSRSQTRPATEGALGRAWSGGEPLAVDLAGSPDGPRAAAAAAAGLALGLVVPMAAAGTTTALEFFCRDAAAADRDAIDSLRIITLQIAQYEQRQQAERRLRFFATHDALTGLHNRDALQHQLLRAIRRAERQRTQLAVMFIDLDRFKHINDTLGHGVGDLLIRACGERLGALLRKDDTVARFGGDEFVLLLENLAGPGDAALLAKRALASLAEPYLLDGHELHVGASIGVSVFPNDGSDAEALVKNADTAMYRAKEQGRGCFSFYAAQMNERGAERLALESGLRRAVARGELELHYQPKLELATRRIVGVEALMRWRHPTLGMIAPDRFIPIAEETGVIDEMGSWALRQACGDAVAWREAGLQPLQVSVNLSPHQLGSRGLITEIRAALEDSGLEPALLELEITEGAMMKHPEQAVQTLEAIRALGVRLAIDDFGTGYSSLSYLRRFPLTTVKIDRSFVKDLCDNADAQALIGSIILLAHGLRMKVVAEGVETAAQLGDLDSRGCDLIQGWLLSKALPAAQLAAFVAQHDARVQRDALPA